MWWTADKMIEPEINFYDRDEDEGNDPFLLDPEDDWDDDDEDYD